MNPVRCLRACAGFTLVEILIAMTALGLASVAIINLQGQVAVGDSQNRQVVAGTQLLQRCAETVLTTRRRLGFTSVSNNLCAGTIGSLSTAVGLKRDDGSNAIGTPPACSSTFCDVTVTLLKGGSPTNTTLTLRLYNY